MAILLVRGVVKTLNAGFNGNVYGPIIWTAAPAGVVDLAPFNGGAQVNVTARPNAPAGGVVLTVSSLNSAKKVIGGSCTCAVEQVVVTPPTPPVFKFPIASPMDVITDHDTITVTLPTTPPGDHLLLMNIKGNGKTVPTCIIPGIAGDHFTRFPAFDDAFGGKAWADTHASGDRVMLYDCADPVFMLPAPSQPPGDPGAPPAPPGPPPVPSPQFTLTLQLGADGKVTVTPPTKFYTVEALPDGNFLAHRGDIWAQPADGIDHLPPHHVDIIGTDGFPLIHADLRAHYWNSCVPFRTKPLTIQRTPADLVAEGFSFPYGDTGQPVGGFPNFQYWGPFTASFAGITIYMPTTGERPDIGLLSDPCGVFMLGRGPGPMLAWAQCVTDFPNFWVDAKTGKLIDLTVYPQADSYDSPGYQADKPYIWKGPKAPDGYHKFGGNMVPQQAHYLDAAYLAGAATKDPILLKGVQAGAVFCVATDGAKSTPTAAIVSGERRGIAWGTAMIFKAARLTKDFEDRGALPSTGFLGSDNFVNLSKSSAAYYGALMTGPVQDTFGLCPGDTTVGPWQQNYWLTVLAFAMLTGRIEWLAFYLKSLGFAVGMYTGKGKWTGWPPGWGTAYYIDTRDNNGTVYKDGGAMFAGFLKTELENVITAAGHGEVYAPQITQAQYDKLMVDPLNGGIAMVGGAYNITARAALVMADHLDRNGPAFIRGKVRGAHPDFDLALKNITTMVKNFGYMEPKVSVIAV